jgi:hypothetical protein
MPTPTMSSTHSRTSKTSPFKPGQAYRTHRWLLKTKTTLQIVILTANTILLMQLIAHISATQAVENFAMPRRWKKDFVELLVEGNKKVSWVVVFLLVSLLQYEDKKNMREAHGMGEEADVDRYLLMFLLRWGVWGGMGRWGRRGVGRRVAERRGGRLRNGWLCYTGEFGCGRRTG